MKIKIKVNAVVISLFYKRVLISVITTILTLFYIGGQSMANERTPNEKRVVLIGASVGKAWNITEIPERVKNNKYSFEYIGMYQYDKSQVLNEILNRNSNKPDAIIIKECAAYFPSDISFENAKNLMSRWIEQIQEHDIVPIPATIVPVTSKRDERFKTHNPVKRLIKKFLGISMITQMQRIEEYNDWIREYSLKNGLAFLDLESPLRISDKDRFLREELTKGDGLHLNGKAYRILDNELIQTLNKVELQSGK